MVKGRPSTHKVASDEGFGRMESQFDCNIHVGWGSVVPCVFRRMICQIIYMVAWFLHEILSFVLVNRYNNGAFIGRSRCW
jgi:hypothetical protein